MKINPRFRNYEGTRRRSDLMFGSSVPIELAASWRKNLQTRFRQDSRVRSSLCHRICERARCKVVISNAKMLARWGNAAHSKARRSSLVTTDYLVSRRLSEMNTQAVVNHCSCACSPAPARPRLLLPLRPFNQQLNHAIAQAGAAATFGCRSRPALSGSEVPCQPSSRKRTRRASGSDRSSSTTAEDDEPLLAGEAIEQGLQVFNEGDTVRALQLFQRSLTLPGTGMKRFRDKPREISDEEKQAALYNTACCLGRMGEPEEALKAVAGCLDNGYTDFDVLRRDPDLAPVRESPKFEGLLKRFEPGDGFFSGILKGFN